MWAFALLDAANGRAAALARPLRDQAPLLRADRRRPLLRLGDQGPAERAGLPARARRGGGPPLPGHRRRRRDRAQLLRGRPQPARRPQRHRRPATAPAAEPRPERYWSIPEEGYEAAANRPRGSSPICFRDSVRVHARSDVPVGTCLSGGLDSSSIVCVAEELRRAGRIPQYAHSGFGYLPDDAAYSERPYMEAVTEQTGLEMTFVEVTPDRFAEALVEVARHQDEPFGSTSIAAQYFVFGAAKAGGMKVMLDGQGADEVLGRLRPLLPPDRGCAAASPPLRRLRALHARPPARAGTAADQPAPRPRHTGPAARRRRGGQPRDRAAFGHAPLRRVARPDRLRGLPLSGVRLRP